MGDEIQAALGTPLYQNGGVNMLTSWYNNPGDLSWMSGYANGNGFSDLYGQGKAEELVVWLAEDPSYAISPQFLTDLQTLVSIFKGHGPNYGPLYVVLFSEFETYSSDPAYLLALRTQYLNAVQVVHSTYSQAKVALGFGGYDWPPSSWSDPDLSFWQPAIAASDFVAFQDMQADTTLTTSGQNYVVPTIENAVAQLSAYSKPIMVSHFKVWDGGDANESAAFAQAAQLLFNPQEMGTLTRQGLFAFGFMNDSYVNTQPGLGAAEAAASTYGATSSGR